VPAALRVESAMAYLEQRATGNRAAIIATVAALHAGAAYLLVSGLAVNVIKDITTVIEGRNIPVEVPPPPPQPKDIPKQDSVITAPRPMFDVPRSAEPMLVPLPLPQPIPQPGPQPTPDFILPEPPQPAPSFAPRSVRPRGRPAEWVSTADYPARELREGAQGTTRFSLLVGADGRVESCVVTASSGSAGLDETTCRAVSRRARFEPATDAGGARVQGSYSGSIRWVIPE
jgi:periplasmic protein TonB